ncbi:MAG: DUF2283 domain-containing protein [Candidatus Nanohaloarchaea archaeon]
MKYQIEDINYDPELDILELYTDKSDYHASSESGDFVYHLTSEGKLVGVEILNASVNLEGTVENLKRIEEAEIESSENEGKVKLNIKLGSGQKALRIQDSQKRETIKV